MQQLWWILWRYEPMRWILWAFRWSCTASFGTTTRWRWSFSMMWPMLNRWIFDGCSRRPNKCFKPKTIRWKTPSRHIESTRSAIMVDTKYRSAMIEMEQKFAWTTDKMISTNKDQDGNRSSMTLIDVLMLCIILGGCCWRTSWSQGKTNYVLDYQTSV